MTNESDPSKRPSAQEPEAGDENTAGDTFNLPGDYRGANIYIKSTIYGSTGNNVRLQNLRDFTVQIRPVDSDVIVGTGMIVSPDGKVVTCAHVVKSAGVEPRALNEKELGVYFPQAFAGDKKDRRAKVIAYFPDFDDDVVLLQLTDGPAPLGPERMPVLGTAEKSQGNGFRSYGYRRLEEYIAGWAHGTIQGHVEAPPKRNVQGEPVQLESNQINRGMSGSAVLDIDRNLVVGIISETWFPDRSGKDSNSGWAVDSRVLSLAPLGLPVQDAPLPFKAAPEPKTDEETKQQVVEAAQSTVAERRIGPNISWNNAPATLHEWTGRNHLLMRLTEDWNDPTKRVTGLIGFGGEGKSSLARKWVDSVIARSEATKQSPHESGIASQSALAMTSPDGVFWWGFYENRSVDEFLEAALNYMSGGRIDPRAVPSSNIRAQIIGSMLGSGRYLFVLDGLEVMQHQEGDQYGLLQSTDLHDLLTFFARPDNQAFCLITSRAPLLDLMEYTTYTHRDVERLSLEDGRALLRELGVKGNDAELNKVVADWDGHALTLSILAAYLAERYEGDIKHLTDVPVPTANEPRYERVHRVLRRYDEHLAKDEREFLKLFSIFRLPVQESAFEMVFQPLLKSLDKDALPKLVSRLANYRLIRHDEHEKAYTTHPLIRSHYFALFTKGDPAQEKAVHKQIKDYYLSIAGDTPKYPTLDDLKPLIEVVHHACAARAYDDAWNVYWDRIYQRDRQVITHQLGAFETNLTIMQEFFPDKKTKQPPKVSNPQANRFILNEVGLCLMSLGRPRESMPFYERKNELYEKTSPGYQNLADLYVYLGALKQSHESAVQALDLARRADDKFDICQSLSYQGRTAHLQGNYELADASFREAESFETEHRYLYSIRGIHHADHLRRTGQADYARRVAETNLQICEQNHFIRTTSLCHRVLGDLDSSFAKHVSARAHYESALTIARSISDRAVLIEALVALGRWQAKHMKDASAAFSDLNEALGYCVESGYRIYEADVRVALAWAYLADLTPSPSPTGREESLVKAKQSAEHALQMSNEIGYHRGKVDAEEVLSVIARSDEESQPTRSAKSTKTKKESKATNKRRSNLK